MFTTEDILNRLRAGEPIDAICREVESAINEATAQYEQEQDHTNAKREVVKNILANIAELLELEGCDPIDYDEDDIDEICNLFTEWVNLIHTMREALPDEDVIKNFSNLFN